MKRQKPLDFVLVKPVGPRCNLKCTYCFYTEKLDYFSSTASGLMSNNTLERLIKLSLNRPGERMGFGWQGGEPTLAGLSFYEKVISFQKQYGNGMVVSNLLQTNGTLLNADWAEFLKEYSFLVGLSIDGPQHVHDKYRKGKEDRGSHFLVERSARLLLEKNVAVNSISVVNSYSAEHLAETYKYLKELGFTYLQFIPCIETDVTNNSSPTYFSVSPESYGRFLCQLFDLWVEDWEEGKPTISERMMDNLLGMYLGMESNECTFRKTCGDYLVVEHNGELFSCDFFVEDAWKLGDLSTTMSLEELLNGRRQELFGQMKNRLPKECLKCEYRWLCHGGCTKDRLRIPKDKRMNHFCKAYKMFHEYTKDKFPKLARIYNKVLLNKRGTPNPLFLF